MTASSAHGFLNFRNQLIWGDNKLVMASLLAEFKGKVDLIYIDPPFDVGADFKMDVPIGDGKETIEKDQSTLEMVAYRDMWGKGIERFGRKHDTILLYGTGGQRIFNAKDPHVASPRKPNSHMRLKVDADGREYQEKTDKKSGKVYRYYVDAGIIPNDYWTDIEQLNWEDAERVSYSTQKPERLLARIIAASSTKATSSQISSAAAAPPARWPSG